MTKKTKQAKNGLLYKQAPILQTKNHNFVCIDMACRRKRNSMVSVRGHYFYYIQLSYQKLQCQSFIQYNISSDQILEQNRCRNIAHFLYYLLKGCFVGNSEGFCIGFLFQKFFKQGSIQMSYINLYKEIMKAENNQETTKENTYVIHQQIITDPTQEQSKPQEMVAANLELTQNEFCRKQSNQYNLKLRSFSPTQKPSLLLSLLQKILKLKKYLSILILILKILFCTIVILTAIFLISIFLTTLNQKKFRNFRPDGGLEDILTDQIRTILSKSRYYDIHYFFDDPHTKMGQIVVHVQASMQSKTISQKRQIITINKTKSQILKIAQSMVYPLDRDLLKAKEPITDLTKIQQMDRAFFFNSMNEHPENNEYFQVEYQYYHEKYNIGNYGDQLPLCVLLAGRNDKSYVQSLYNSIKRQNYTNYRIVHMDDASADGSPEKVKQYLVKHPQLASKVTLVTQPFRRNALFNRNLGIRKYCGENDIIIDMDSDDWILGKQVFQMVNTIYQTGQIYQGKKQQLWAIYFGNIYRPPGSSQIQFPYGPFEQKDLISNEYRHSEQWKATSLRTYRRKLYMKIDQNDFLDPESLKPGYFFLGHSDAFMGYSIIELCGPKHVNRYDQFVYYYNNYSPNKMVIEILHSSIAAQVVDHYHSLNSLQDEPSRYKHLKQHEGDYKIYERMRREIIEKRTHLKKQLQKLVLPLISNQDSSRLPKKLK